MLVIAASPACERTPSQPSPAFIVLDAQTLVENKATTVHLGYYLDKDGGSVTPSGFARLDFPDVPVPLAVIITCFDPNKQGVVTLKQRGKKLPTLRFVVNCVCAPSKDVLNDDYAGQPPMLAAQKCHDQGGGGSVVHRWHLPLMSTVRNVSEAIASPRNSIRRGD
jgi:hypothetical protein